LRWGTTGFSGNSLAIWAKSPSSGAQKSRDCGLRKKRTEQITQMARSDRVKVMESDED
jgi:hypothetical protein